jgi:NAD+ kinase
MKVGIFFRKQIDKVIHVAGEIINFLKQNNISAYIDEDLKKHFDEPVINDVILKQLDFFISIGGDGTFLEAAQIVMHSETPLIGVNYGYTGFLTSIEKEEVLLSLEDLINGKYKIETRSILSYELIRNGEILHTGFVINDLVVQREPLSKVISIDVFSNKRKISSFRGDGIIISTATGSTAYSLSAGGPILDPECHDVIIYPLCPHKLSSRCVVIPDNRIISVTANCNMRPTLLITDGKSKIQLHNMDKLQIQKSKKDLKIIMLHEKNFFEIVNQKFQWGL